MSRTLLLHASLPPSFWVYSVHMVAYILNILPSTTIQNKTPTEILFRRVPTYDHLRTFGCLCYPNLSAIAPHKLAPRSTPCVFLGFPSNHRGYLCYDLSSHKIIVSRHVTFVEDTFPFSNIQQFKNIDYDFLEHDTTTALRVYSHATPSPNTQAPTSPPPARNPHPLSAASSRTPLPSTPPSPSRQCPTRPTSPVSPMIQFGSLPQPTPTHIPPTRPIPTPSHPMATRAKCGIFKPNPKYQANLSVLTISPLPKNPKLAMLDHNWNAAMKEEFNALTNQHTWDLVPRPEGVNIIRCMWLFKHKYRENGDLERHKARLVVNGKSQQVGVDCDETFSPVVKPATIRTVLSIAMGRDWPIHQLDVKNAFLHGDLKETVFMHQPPGFVNPHAPTHVCRLRKSLYGLKQAPRAWYQRFANYLLRIGFVCSKSDNSLFILRHGANTAYLLLYVDDIVLTASSEQLKCDIIALLKSEFSMTDLGKLSYFLGISVTRTKESMFLCQSKYAEEIIHRAKMDSCKPVATPVDTKSKLGAHDGEPMTDPSLYRSLAGALQYLTFTRPGIAYVVQQVCLFMHAPREPHFNALKRIIRYIKGTSDHGLHLYRSAPTRLISYTDADWAGCPDTRRSTSGYCVY